MRMIPRLVSGSVSTFLEYLPVPVTMKYWPVRGLASKPVGMVRSTLPVSRYSATSSSRSRQLMLPPLRSSQPRRYMLAVVCFISSTKGAVRMSFIVSTSLAQHILFVFQHPGEPFPVHRLAAAAAVLVPHLAQRHGLELLLLHHQPGQVPLVLQPLEQGIGLQQGKQQGLLQVAVAG